MADRVVLCIGTKKGLFVAEAAKTRKSFALRGPFGAGVAVYSALVDRRGKPRWSARKPKRKLRPWPSSRRTRPDRCRIARN